MMGRDNPIFDFSNAMVEKYPEFFENNTFYFATGPGWDNHIHNLLARIKEHVEAGHPSIKIRQVKEKFGTLRFYYDGGSPEIFRLVGGQVYRTLCDEHDAQIKDWDSL